MEWFWLCNSIISVSSFSQRSELKHWNPHGNFSTDCCLKSVFVFTSIIILLSVKKRDRYKWIILKVILKNPSCYLMPLLWMAHGLIHQEGYHHSDPLLCLCTGILISGQWIHCGKVKFVLIIICGWISEFWNFFSQKLCNLQEFYHLFWDVLFVYISVIPIIRASYGFSTISGLMQRHRCRKKK